MATTGLPEGLPASPRLRRSVARRVVSSGTCGIQRRRAQGKTNREIKRYLVRYVARQLYRQLETNRALTHIGASQGLTAAPSSVVSAGGSPGYR
jgi:hypothetical protein